MKFEINAQQLKAINEAFDIALKNFGLQIAYQVLELTQILEKPIGEKENTKIFELSESHVKGLTEILNISLKQLGIQGLYGVLGLIELLKNPIKEEKEDE